MCACARACACTCTHVLLYVHVCVSLCLCVCACACVCVSVSIGKSNLEHLHVLFKEDVLLFNQSSHVMNTSSLLCLQVLDLWLCMTHFVTCTNSTIKVPLQNH